MSEFEKHIKKNMVNPYFSSGFHSIPWRFRSANQALQAAPVFQSLLREKSSEARGASAWDGRLDLGSHGVVSSWYI